MSLSFYNVLLIFASFRIEHNLFFDAPLAGQITFQRPATQTMDQLTDLHHDVFSLLFFLCIVVFYLLAQIIYKFRATNFQTPRNFFFKAHTVLEIL
jgi:heme/copper-type cytochrome/quinol oxidase subunit 2